MFYRAEIDGLRALSIIAVVLYHCGITLFQGGFLGVDVFFVISGYLITSHIALTISQGSFRLTTFYARRAKRLLPAIVFMCLVTAPIMWYLADPYELKEFGQSLVSTFTFSSNVFFYLKTGYFDTESELKPLLHTWSLAVEEQFYLLFPLLLLLLKKTRFTFAIVIILMVVSWLNAYISYPHSPDITFYFLHTRAWELLLGAVVAMASTQTQKKPKGVLFEKTGVLSIIGTISIVSSFLLFKSNQANLPLLSLVPTLGCAAILWECRANSMAHRLLTLRAFVWIGTISYSLYLFHQPLLALGRMYYLEPLSPLQTTILITISVALAAFSKKFVEDYFRFHYNKGKNRWLVVQLTPVCIMFAFFGLITHQQKGFPERSELGMTLAQNYGISSKCSGADINDRACWTSETPKTLLWGDSYAMHFAKALDNISPNGMIQATLSNCSPTGKTTHSSSKSFQCDAFNAQVIAFLERSDSKIEKIYISSSFETTTKQEFLSLENTIDKLKEKGYQVFLVSPTAKNSGILRCIKLSERNNFPIEECSFSESELSNLRIFKRVEEIADNARVQFIDLRQLNCQHSTCSVSKNETILYRDNGHLSVPSSEIVSNFFTKQIKD